MQTRQSAEEPAFQESGWILVTFPSPARRYVSREPIHDSYWNDGFVEVDGVSLFPEESAWLDAPDLIVDLDSGQAIGLAFDVNCPNGLDSLWCESVKGYDPHAFRVSRNSDVDGKVYETVEVFWSTPGVYERVFASFDFGLWALLYKGRGLHETGREHLRNAPMGFVVADVPGLVRPALVGNGHFSEIERVAWHRAENGAW